MNITGAQAVVKILELEGVNVVFGYPGGAILPVYDALLHSEIKHVLVRNEQAAAHAANGYARSSGKAGVCISTSGPGATNLVTGIATAYMDSIPLIAITGQVPTNMIGRDVFQEVDITGATAPFTKHNYLIKNAEDIPRVFKEAFYIAVTGRPGPVLIDIPKDVQMALLDFEYPEKAALKGYKPSYNVPDDQLESIIDALNKSERPLICVGGGAIISNAGSELIEFAELTNIPVTSTLMGIGAFPETHRLSLGMLGSNHGVYPAKKAVDEADLLIVLGARMADRSTGDFSYFAKDAVIVHIDIDPAEIGKNVDIDIPIVGDIKKVLQYLIKKLKDKKFDAGNHKEWLAKTQQWKIREYGVGEGLSFLNPMEVIKALSKSADKENTVIVTDVGQHQLWAGRYYKVEKPRNFITSGGLGTMGYGLPAAIGVKIASPNKEVVLITGDGSFQMSLPELATIAQEGLKIKILLFNNSCLGMVRELQQFYHNERYYQVHMKGNPDFTMLAKAYGIHSFKVTDKDSMDQVIQELLHYDGPVLGEFIIDDKANVIPMM